MTKHEPLSDERREALRRRNYGEVLMSTQDVLACVPGLLATLDEREREIREAVEKVQVAYGEGYREGAGYAHDGTWRPEMIAAWEGSRARAFVARYREEV